jgi:predicted nucleic acid-binding protein
MVVLDSSTLVALLTDGGQLGDWVADAIAGAVMTGPQLLAFETANILRRQQRAGEIDASAATLAHANLLALPLRLWPY